MIYSISHDFHWPQPFGPFQSLSDLCETRCIRPLVPHKAQLLGLALHVPRHALHEVRVRGPAFVASMMSLCLVLVLCAYLHDCSCMFKIGSIHINNVCTVNVHFMYV